MKDKIRSVDFGFYDGFRLRTVHPFTDWTLYGEANEIIGTMVFEINRQRIPSPKNATEIKNLINLLKKK